MFMAVVRPSSSQSKSVDLRSFSGEDSSLRFLNQTEIERSREKLSNSTISYNNILQRSWFLTCLSKEPRQSSGGFRGLWPQAPRF